MDVKSILNRYLLPVVVGFVAAGTALWGPMIVIDDLDRHTPVWVLLIAVPLSAAVIAYGAMIFVRTRGRGGERQFTFKITEFGAVLFGAALAVLGPLSLLWVVNQMSVSMY